MKKLSSAVLLLASLFLALPAAMAEPCAEQNSACQQDATSKQSPAIEPVQPAKAAEVEERQDSAFVLFDVIVYRPLGLVATIVGAALYVGISPFTALASIPPPHDAFAKVGDILVVAPAAYTFQRPLGKRALAY